MGEATETCWFCKKAAAVEECAVKVELYRLVKDEETGLSAVGTIDHTRDAGLLTPGLAVMPPENGRQHAQASVPRCGRCRAKHAHASERGCSFQLVGAGIGAALGIVYGILERKVTSALVGVGIGAVLGMAIAAGIARIFVPVRNTKQKRYALRNPKVQAAEKAGWLLGVGPTMGKGTFVWTYDE